MKKLIALLLALLMLAALCSCGGTNEIPATDTNVQAEPEVEMNSEDTVPADEEPALPPFIVNPLPDTTMDNLDDAVLSISLEEGGAYVDDTGKMQMDLTIYTYDKYDMVDISQLKEGDIIVTHAGEVEVVSIERNSDGTVCINGDFNLVTDDCGLFYENNSNDAKSWYEAGKATIRVSADFRGCDNIDPEQGEIILYPGDFLVGAVTNYNFTPYNTTIRVENGQIVELDRVYNP